MAVVRVIQAYRFALEPSAAQEQMLRSHAGAARFAWNWGPAKCADRYAAEGTWYYAIDLPMRAMPGPPGRTARLRAGSSLMLAYLQRSASLFLEAA